MGGAAGDLPGRDRYGAAICRYLLGSVGFGPKLGTENDIWFE